MKSRQRKVKGRKLQVALAEKLALELGLTIEAQPPTPVGIRANGVNYLAEDQWPSLRIRRMGEPGADVALLSPLARNKVRLYGCPLYFECKNHERLEFSKDIWTNRTLPTVQVALSQAVKSCPEGWLPCAVVSKNRWPVLVGWPMRESVTLPVDATAMRMLLYVEGAGEMQVMITDLHSFTEVLRMEARVR